MNKQIAENALKTLHIVPPTECWIIKNTIGQRVAVSSGKRMWSKRHHAVSALRNHFAYRHHGIGLDEIVDMTIFVDELISSGVISIVNVKL